MSSYLDLPFIVADEIETVAAEADLPTGLRPGSIRYAEAEEALFVYTPSGWKQITAS